ncbi:hypothetical protein [Gimesia sp.]|uniref:hypothetical protein n=1 Tax=Gimesia sp. TaxID=2024833 RepID=UPI003A91736F
MNRLFVLLILLFPSFADAEPNTIIHILNYHYVSPGEFAADLKDQDNTVTQEQIDKAYSYFLKVVEANQRDQMKLLRRLIKEHNLKAVYVEGLTEQNHKGTLRFIETLKKYERTKTDPPESGIDRLVAAQNRLDRLELGAVGLLVVSGELETILPAEDSAAFDAANPVKADGSIEFDKEAEERREDAIVRNLLKADGVAVITLGEAHVLSDNLRRLGSDCKYKLVVANPQVIKRAPSVKE